MLLNKLIDGIKRKGKLWEIFHKIVIIGLLAYIALALSWIDKGIEENGRDIVGIQLDISDIQSDVSSIQSDVSDIQTNTN
jgi:hypothetical protein